MQEKWQTWVPDSNQILNERPDVALEGGENIVISDTQSQGLHPAGPSANRGQQFLSGHAHTAPSPHGNVPTIHW